MQQLTFLRIAYLTNYNIESERPTARPRTLPPSPLPSSPPLQTEIALFLSMMNSQAALEALTGAKKEDITRLETRMNSMAATMEG